MQGYKILVLIIFVIIVQSCSMDYENMEAAEELGQNIPDNVIENFFYTRVDNGSVVFRLYSKKAENYSQKNETILYEVIFREYNLNNDIATEGTAETGLLHTDSDDAELTGTLIYSTENEVEINAEYLYWNDANKTLSGSENGIVKLFKDSGTQISGTGFKGDLRTKFFNFERDVKGIYKYEDD